MIFTVAELKRLNLAANVICGRFEKGGKLYAMGNGGSLCDAMHFCEELSGKFRKDRRPLPALAIADPSYITCVGNDYGFQEIFARFLRAFAGKNDVVVALSTSGNSTNILRGMETAIDAGALVIGFTKEDANPDFKVLCDICFDDVTGKTSDPIQELHICLLHKLVEFIELRLNLA